MTAKLNRLHALTSHSGVMKDCVSRGRYIRALEIYDKMPITDRDDVCSVLALKACIRSKNLGKGIEIHHELQQTTPNRLQNVHLQSALINLYGEHSDIDTAVGIFNQIPPSKRDAVIITSMMSAHIHCGQHREALDLYADYPDIDIDGRPQKRKPIGHLLALKACSNLKDLDRGQQIHSLLREQALIQNEHIKTELIHFYGHCGDIESAENVFYSEPTPTRHSVICIGSMLTAYNVHRQYADTLNLFQSTLRCRPEIKRNDTALSQALKACTATMDIRRGHEIAGYIVGLGMGRNDVQWLRLRTALIQFYGAIGDINAATDILNAIPAAKWDVFVVDVMMDALCANERYIECLELFNKMERANHLIPSVLTAVNVFRACSAETLFYFGHRVHDRLREHKVARHLLKHREVQTALISFYGKCGVLERCEAIFEVVEQTESDENGSEISIWNSMITAHGRNGSIDRATELYRAMTERVGLEPDTQTFIALIGAHCTVGDVDTAQRIWEHEIGDDAVKYDEFVMTVLLDGMAKKGLLAETKAMIIKYHAHCKVMWMSLLSAAHSHSDRKMVDSVYQEIVSRFDDDDRFMTSVSVLMTKALLK